MRKAWIYSVLVGALAIALGAGSWAVAGGGKKQVDAELGGLAEPPSVSTTGLGTFEAEIDDDGALSTISYTLSYSGLEGTLTTGAHIHPGQRSVNGGVSAFLCGGGDKPPCTPTSGTFSGVIDAADVIGPAGQGIAAGEIEELIAAIRAGATYANVHTNKHPGGEIRGQINDDNQRDG